MNTSTKPAHEIVSATAANDLYYRDGIDWPVGGDESLRGHGTIRLRRASQRVDIWSGPKVAAPPQFAAGWNSPGYLPDNPPELFDSASEAWDYLLEEADRYADEMREMAAEGRTELEQSIIDEVSQLETAKGEGSYLIGGLVYFVYRAEADQ